MTAIQLNAEILRNLGALAEDEGMLKRVAKYLRKNICASSLQRKRLTLRL